MKLRLLAITALLFFSLNANSQAEITGVVSSFPGLSTDTSIVPVRFISFIAQEGRNIVQLTWKVEIRNFVTDYKIERSTNGLDFSAVAEKKDTAEHDGTTKYTYTDSLTGYPQILYYRIKQYDQRGRFYFSKTLTVRLNPNASDVIMYPNPASDKLYLNITNAENGLATATVWNATGAQVISQQFILALGNNILTINGIEKLPYGIYQVHVKLPGGKEFSQPVLKK